MPFTPFHLGPAMLLGFKYERKLDLMSLALASVVLDVEPALNIIIGKGDVHGFFHSFAGATIAGVVMIVLLHFLNPAVNRLRSLFRVEQGSSLKTTASAVFLGIYLHVFLDSFLYPEIKPLYPSSYNPMFNQDFLIISYVVIYLFCAVTLIIAFSMYKRRL
ncbi:MAG: metal-dependent hydrolase [Thermoplasmatales archaeon]|nr:metal-dependent hydrolase [Thermoplasmatales archaeon]